MRFDFRYLWYHFEIPMTRMEMWEFEVHLYCRMVGLGCRVKDLPFAVSLPHLASQGCCYVNSVVLFALVRTTMSPATYITVNFGYKRSHR
jgi:hypothetical protein